jgi:hypothetical protein
MFTCSTKGTFDPHPQVCEETRKGNKREEGRARKKDKKLTDQLPSSWGAAGYENRFQVLQFP